MKDLSVHTRLPPEQRVREVGRLIEYINKYVMRVRGVPVVFIKLVIRMMGGGGRLDYQPRLEANCLLSMSWNRDDNVQKELRDWGLRFEPNLLSFSGRVVQSERIHQGGKTVSS